MIFTTLTLIAILVGTAIELLPTFMIEDTVTGGKPLKPYTALELTDAIFTSAKAAISAIRR